MKFLNKKFWVMAASLLVLGAAGAGAMGGGETTTEQKFKIPPPTPEQQKNAEEWRKYRVRYDTPKCSGDILVEMGDVRLMVPRSASFALQSGEIKVDLRHPLYNCSLQFLGDVRLVYLKKGLKLQSLSKESKPYTWAERYRSQINQAQKDNDIRALDSGLKMIDLAGSELYLFPENLFPTADGEPVVFNCGKKPEGKDGFFPTTFCSTSYIHPSGLSVSYRFFRKTHPENEFTEIDRDWRQLIADMLASAKN